MSSSKWDVVVIEKKTGRVDAVVGEKMERIGHARFWTLSAEVRLVRIREYLSSRFEAKLIPNNQEDTK